MPGRSCDDATVAMVLVQEIQLFRPDPLTARGAFLEQPAPPSAASRRHPAKSCMAAASEPAVGHHRHHRRSDLPPAIRNY
jgi:hypothetical protein